MAMTVEIKLPTPRLPGEPARADARFQLERLYRDIGISAVASALHAQSMKTPEQRETESRSSHDLLKILGDDGLAA